MRIEGLETLDYFDNLMRRERFTEQADAITFDGEVTKFYYALIFHLTGSCSWNIGVIFVSIVTSRETRHLSSD